MLLTLPVREILPATPRARLLRLDLGDRPFAYKAGQAVLAAGHGRAPRRPYSLAAAPEHAARDRWLELLVGVDESDSPGPHLDLAADSHVDLEGPVGSFVFPDDPPVRRFLFVAGGTGIAPLRAMLGHALAVSHRNVGLLYSARGAGEFAFQEEFAALARGGLIDFRQTVTRAIADTWTGGRGRIGKPDLAPLVHDPQTLCFVCGPPSLVHDIPRLLGELGVPAELIRIEEWA